MEADGLRAFLIGNGSLTAAGDRAGALLQVAAPWLAPDAEWLRRPARLGLAVDGILRWLPDGFESRQGDPSGVPIADLSLLSPDLELELWIESYVDARLPVIVRRVQVTNRGTLHRALTLYFHHDVRLAAGRPLESVPRDPASGGLLHSSGRRAMLFNLTGPDGVGVPLVRAASRGTESAAGADADAREGGREPRAEASGIVDAVGGVALSLPPGESAMVTAWLAFGATPEEARAADEALRRESLAASLLRTRGHWNLWSSEGAREFADLPELVSQVYASSLLALRLHQTPSGAIVSGFESAPGAEGGIGGGGGGGAAGAAEGDPPWCRLADGAVAADSLGRAGYAGAARRYFAFVADAAGRAGHVAAAYEPSGEPVTLPGDAEAARLGAALHLWALARHVERDRDVEFLAPIWSALVVPAADHLAGSVGLTADAASLPRTIDWWHE